MWHVLAKLGSWFWAKRETHLWAMPDNHICTLFCPWSAATLFPTSHVTWCRQKLIPQIYAICHLTHFQHKSAQIWAILCVILVFTCCPQPRDLWNYYWKFLPLFIFSSPSGDQSPVRDRLSHFCQHLSLQPSSRLIFPRFIRESIGSNLSISRGILFTGGGAPHS